MKLDHLIVKACKDSWESFVSSDEESGRKRTAFYKDHFARSVLCYSLTEHWQEESVQSNHIWMDWMNPSRLEDEVTHSLFNDE